MSQLQEFDSSNALSMSAAGLKYTGDGDTARCKDCGLEVSNWISDMDPFKIHFELQRTCPFVCSIMHRISNPSKCQKIEKLDPKSFSNISKETDLLQQVRKRTFSHWPQRLIPSSAQMVEAGFFSCNVGDRVICIYCNLIAQQWTAHTDDPCEVHKTLSPNCSYVKAKLVRPISLSTTNDTSPLRSNDIEYTASCNPTYSEVPKRYASYDTWPTEALPSVDDFVGAGFFYTGTKARVTCFYCNGSLQNWGPNDNPMIEHVRWFPHCAYARQLCGKALYRKIQELKQVQRERSRINEMDVNAGINDGSCTNIINNNRQLLIPDENTLSKLVAARLNSSISQRLLAENFKLSVIKRCWEDQLRIKKNDFVSDCDLYMACVILKKQIEHINGNKENIVVPSKRMAEIKQKKRKIDDFKESIERKIEREQSFKHWQRYSPAPIDMITAGWCRDEKISPEYTKCLYCRVEQNEWNVDDDPLEVHRQLSPSCPFILSSHRLDPSEVPRKSPSELLAQINTNANVTESNSNFILPSNTHYSCPPKRELSFASFHGLFPAQITELVRSGLYYPRIGTAIKCYSCGGLFTDMHTYPIDQILIQHRIRFPECNYAHLLPNFDDGPSININNLCRLCFRNSKEIVIANCMHLAICNSCSQIINSCPLCTKKPEGFFKVFL